MPDFGILPTKAAELIKRKCNYMADIILGIESSCDDTSAAVIKDGYLLSNVLASQEVHKAYGGVIPELASRAQQVNISLRISQPSLLPEALVFWVPFW